VILPLKAWCFYGVYWGLFTSNCLLRFLDDAVLSSICKRTCSWWMVSVRVSEAIPTPPPLFPQKHYSMLFSMIGNSFVKTLVGRFNFFMKSNKTRNITWGGRGWMFEYFMVFFNIFSVADRTHRSSFVAVSRHTARACWFCCRSVCFYNFAVGLCVSTILVQDIPWCLKYNDKTKLHVCMRSVWHNNMCTILMATSFGHNNHHQAVLQKLKRSWYIQCKIFNLYGIPFTFM
jgi:hypothetical protein